MAQRTGLEPATPGVTGRYSNQLNYHCTVVDSDDIGWWVVTGSNRRHSACKADALPTELITLRTIAKQFIQHQLSSKFVTKLCCCGCVLYRFTHGCQTVFALFLTIFAEFINFTGKPLFSLVLYFIQNQWFFQLIGYFPASACSISDLSASGLVVGA